MKIIENTFVGVESPDHQSSNIKGAELEKKEILSFEWPGSNIWNIKLSTYQSLLSIWFVLKFIFWFEDASSISENEEMSVYE